MNIIKNIPNNIYVRSGNPGFEFPLTPSFTFPFFVFSPYDAHHNFDTSFSIEVVAGGIGPFVYQWYKDDSPIIGATESFFNFVSAASSDTGFYKAKITSPIGSAESRPAYIHITLLPNILIQPLSATLDPLQNYTFSVSAVGTGEALTYQWYKNYNKINGATQRSYTLNSISETDEAFYKVIVSNNAGHVSSNTVNLSVNNPAGIITQPTNVTIESFLNDGSQTVTFSASVSGTEPISYQWWRKSSSSPSFSAIFGANNNVYTLPIVYLSGNGDKFYMAATNSALNGGFVTTEQVTLSVIKAPLNFTSLPVGLTANPGTFATLNVTATGTNPIIYQWYKNGSSISGANSSSLTFNGLSGLVESDQGEYRVSIYNLVDSLTSSPAFSVIVNDPVTIVTQPSAYSAVVFSNSYTVSVSAVGELPISYQWYKNNGTLIEGASSSSYTITSVTSSDENTYFCVLSNIATPSLSTTTARLSVLYPVGILTQPTSFSVNVGTITTLTVTVSGTQPIYYTWYKNGTVVSEASSSSFTLNNGSGIIESNQGYYEVSVSNAVNRLTSSPAAFVNVNDPITIITQPSAYSAVISPDSYTVSVEATGESPILYQWYKNNGTLIEGATSSSYTINSVTSSDQDTYFCVLSNIATPSLSTTTARLSVWYPVGIITQPVNTSVNVLDFATFFIVATGTPPLTYQWYKNGSVISNENNTSISVWSFESSQGYYSVSVKNAVSSLTSNSAFLNVNDPIVILTQPPSDVTVATNTNYTISVSAKGEAPISYQWYKNNTLIFAASSDSYTIYSASVSDNGTYYCVLSNVATPLLSTNTTNLIVGEPLGILTQPTDILGPFNEINNEAVFNITLSGQEPRYYQWYKDNQLVYVSNSSQYIVDSNRPISIDDFGTYYVTVSNALGTITSVSATLSGSINGITLWNFDYSNNSYYVGYFNGSSALSSAYSTDFNLVSGDFTLECLFYMTSSTAGNQFIMSKDGTSGVTVPQYSLFINSSRYCNLILGDGAAGGRSANTFTFTNAGQIPLSTWNHVAVTRQGSTINFFLNGVLTDSQASTTTMYESTIRPLLIGYETGQPSSDYFNGYISNMRIVKNQAIYTGTFTPFQNVLSVNSLGSTGAGVVPSLTGIVSLLALQDYTFIDNSTNSKTISRIGNPTVVRTSVPILSTKDIVLQSASVGVSSGNIQYITWGDGNYDSNIASNQTLTHTYSSILPLGIERELTPIRSTSTLLDTVSYGSPTSPIIQFTYVVTGIDVKYEWYRRILNTANVATDDINTYTLVPGATSVSYTIDGRDYGYGTYSIFARAYNASTQAYSLTSEFLIRNNTYVAYFNGSSYLSAGNYASSQDFNLTNSDFTIETFFNCIKLTNDSQTIVDQGGISGLSFSQYSLKIGSDGILRFYAGDGTGLAGGMGTYGISAIDLNSWYHFAATRRGSMLYFFLNGKLINSSAMTVPMSANINKALLIGTECKQASASNFNGYLYNFRIVKNQAIYTGDFEPYVARIKTATTIPTGSGVVPSLTGLVTLAYFSEANGNLPTYPLVANGSVSFKQMTRVPATLAGITTQYYPMKYATFSYSVQRGALGGD